MAIISGDNAFNKVPQDSWRLSRALVSPLAAGAAANILWGSTFLATQTTLLTWGPLASTVIRFSVAVVALAAFLAIRRIKFNPPRTRSEWFWIGLTAFTGFGALYPLQVSGLQFISSGFSAALMLSSPLFVVAIALALGEKISRLKWLALTLGMAGGIWLLTDRQQTSLLINVDESAALKGTIFTVIASLCLAISAVTGKRALKTMSPASVTFWTMLIGLAMVVPFALVEVQPTLEVSLSAWIPMLYLALACSVLAFFLWNYGLRYGDPQKIAGTMHLKTPVAIVLGVTVNKESLSPQMVGAVALVLFAVWLSGRK